MKAIKLLLLYVCHLLEINEVDFRSLTVQKVKRLIPNQTDVQIEILGRIEVLRANAVMAKNAILNSTFGNSQQDPSRDKSGGSTEDPGTQNQNCQNMDVKTEIKIEPLQSVHYRGSEGSDVEVLSSPEGEENEESSQNNDSDGSIIIERTRKKPKKRLNVLNKEDIVFAAVRGAKVARTTKDKDNLELGPEGESVEFNQNQSSEDTIPGPSTPENIPESSDSTPRTCSLRRKRNSSFKKFFDESYTNVTPEAESSRVKRKRNPDDKVVKKVYTIVDAEFIKTAKRSLRKGEKLAAKRNYKIDHSVEECGQDLFIFYNNLGKYIQRLELEFWKWVPKHQTANNTDRIDLWTTDLKEILYFFCPKLEVLTLRESSPDTINNETSANESYWNGKFRELLKLKEINLTNCSKYALKQLKIIFKAARNLERFQFVFQRVEQVSDILSLIKSLSLENRLQELTELSIVGLGENLSLNSEHFQTLSSSNLIKLNYLEISCGLEDVSKESFESVLSKFSTTLEVLNCRGTFFGHDSRYFTIKAPRMDKLRYFSLGSDYEFVFERTEQNRNSMRIRNEDENEQSTAVYDVEEKDFVNFGLQLCNLYPMVETIRIGSMCTLDDLHFFNFPNLKNFCCGGPWDRMIKFPSANSRHPSYHKIEAIQLPDYLMNEALIFKIPTLFPNLKKVWVWLPSAQCLNTFFKTMVKSQLRELHLKTSFCFSWTLVEMLIGKHRSGPRPSTELKKLDKLKKYKYFAEYIAQYNVDIPWELSDETDPALKVIEEELISDADDRVEFFNRKLKIVELEHVGRVLQIPKGEYSFKDSRCEFYSDELGFLKDYPLSTGHYINGFTVNDEDKRRYKCKNIRIPRVVSLIKRKSKKIWEDSDGGSWCFCEYKSDRSKCECFNNRPCRVDSEDDTSDPDRFGRKTAQFKVKVRPTSGLLNITGKVKVENRA